MRAAVAAGNVHWREAALSLLRLHRADPGAAEATIAAWVEEPGALVLWLVFALPPGLHYGA